MSDREAREARLKQFLSDRMALGKDDHRWNDYSPNELIREAQEELVDALLYLEKLRSRLADA